MSDYFPVLSVRPDMGEVFVGNTKDHRSMLDNVSSEKRSEFMMERCVLPSSRFRFDFTISHLYQFMTPEHSPFRITDKTTDECFVGVDIGYHCRYTLTVAGLNPATSQTYSTGCWTLCTVTYNSDNGKYSLYINDELSLEKYVEDTKFDEKHEYSLYLGTYGVRHRDIFFYKKELDNLDVKILWKSMLQKYADIKLLN